METLKQYVIRTIEEKLNEHEGKFIDIEDITSILLKDEIINESMGYNNTMSEEWIMFHYIELGEITKGMKCYSNPFSNPQAFMLDVTYFMMNYYMNRVINRLKLKGKKKITYKIINKIMENI